MSQECSVVAVNIGATSGDVALVTFSDDQVRISHQQQINVYTVEAYRRTFWNALRSYSEIQEAITNILSADDGAPPDSIAVSGHIGDTLVLVDTKGHVLGLPACYDPDRHTTLTYIRHTYPDTYRSRLAGFNTKAPNLYEQLIEMKVAADPRLEVAETLISLPDLYLYWLSGNTVAEVTGASNTFLYDMVTQDWARELVARQGIPEHILPSIVQPGTLLGRYRGMKILATASSEVAASVAAIPNETDDFAYLVAGNYTVVGVLMDELAATRARNSSGFNHQIATDGRLLLSKQVDGLHFIYKVLTDAGILNDETNMDDLLEQAEAVVLLQRLVPPAAFSEYGEVGFAAVEAAYSNAGQPTPVTDGEVLRSLLESLALSLADAVALAQKTSKKPVEVLHLVGEAAQFEILGQFIADAAGLPVVVGPVSAALWGNAAVQMAMLSDEECNGYSREIMMRSIETVRFEPQNIDAWNDARAGRFTDLA